MLFKVGVYVCIHSRLRESLVESMSGYSFACGIRSLDLANPRQKNSSPSGEVNISKKHYAASSDRKLSLAALTALVIGSVVGSGIFTLPSKFGQATGVLGFVIAWVIAGTGMWLLSSGRYHNANLSLTREFTRSLFPTEVGLGPRGVQQREPARRAAFKLASDLRS
jgi:hypothetical protein